MSTSSGRVTGANDAAFDWHELRGLASSRAAAHVGASTTNSSRAPSATGRSPASTARSAAAVSDHRAPVPRLPALPSPAASGRVGPAPRCDIVDTVANLVGALPPLDRAGAPMAAEEGRRSAEQQSAMSRLAQPPRRQARVRLPLLAAAGPRAPLHQDRDETSFIARAFQKRQSARERRLQQILAEMEAQRGFVERVLHPPSNLAERMAEHRSRERDERNRRAEQLRRRAEQTAQRRQRETQRRVEAEEAARAARRERNRRWAGWQPTRHEAHRAAEVLRAARRSWPLECLQRFARAAVAQRIIVGARRCQLAVLVVQPQPQPPPPPPPPPTVLSLGGLLLAADERAKPITAPPNSGAALARLTPRLLRQRQRRHGGAFRTSRDAGGEFSNDDDDDASDPHLLSRTRSPREPPPADDPVDGIEPFVTDFVADVLRSALSMATPPPSTGSATPPPRSASAMTYDSDALEDLDAGSEV